MTENTAKKEDEFVTEWPEIPAENTVGATESRLLQAMSVDTLSADTPKAKMIDIVEKIRTVSDPEIPINVYDMGLIYKIDQKDTGDLYIEMTLTAPTCPIAGVLPQQVADAVAQTDGVGQVEVKLVWEPAWTPDKMTDEAKEILELF